MIKKTRYPLPHTENKLTRQIHNNLTKHHYIKEISKWTYHIKKQSLSIGQTLLLIRKAL